MKRTLQTSPTAVSYARSLLELANERNAAVDVGEEMKALAQILDENPPLREMLANPAVKASQRVDTIDKLFKGTASELSYNLIRVANQKGRAGMLGEIAAAYAVLLDVQLGKVDVEVTSAQPLDEAQVADLAGKIGQSLGKTAVVHAHVDESIIGGLTVRVGDQVLDASVRYRLKAMRQQLMNAAQNVSTAAL